MKKILSFLLIAALLCCPVFPASYAAAPGETQPDALRSLREIACGYAFDRAILTVRPGDAEVSELPFAKDTRVIKIESWPHTPAPGEQATDWFVCVWLDTDSNTGLQAYMDDYRNEPYIVVIEPDGFGYIPEDRFAVEVTLRLWDEETGSILPLRTDYAPSAFSDTLVSAVYVSQTAVRPYAKDEQATLDALEDAAVREVLQSGVPTQLVLLPRADAPQDAASLALTLIEYEDSAVLTDAQKALIRQRVADVRMVTYEGYEEDAAERFLGKTFIRIWVPAAKGETFEAHVAGFQLDAGAQCYPAVNDGDNILFHITFEEAPEETELRRLAGALGADETVLNYRVYRGFDVLSEMQKDSLAADLFFVSLSIPGDADGDGALSAADARLALRAAVGLDDPDERGCVAMNVDGAAGITAQDARLILRTAVGLENVDALSFTLESDSGGAGATFGVYEWNDGGYDWTLSTDPAADTVRRFYADTLAPGTMGGYPSFFHVHFSAPGDYTLRFVLQRPWEPLPLETRLLRVTVL